MMKIFFNNLKPFLAYLVPLAVYLLLGLFEIFSFQILIVIFFIIFSLSFILLGYYNDIKNILYGQLLLTLQFILCPILFAQDIENDFLSFLMAAGNVLHSTFLTGNDIWMYLLSIALPLLLITAGYGLSKLKGRKKQTQ